MHSDPLPCLDMFVEYRDLGRMPYKACWEHQQALFAETLRLKGAAGNRVGYLLTVEHPPVYTLGKRAREENLIAGEEFLRARGAEVFRIDRGGDVTFHGPGQLVVYPILDLERLGLGLRDYIDTLEGAVIDGLVGYGIRGERITGASGVWICDEERPARKICAIGVRASRYVTMHGFALNISTDLNYFGWINPCGFTDRGVTSVERETGHRVPMEEVRERIVELLCEKLNVKIYK